MNKKKIIIYLIAMLLALLGAMLLLFQKTVDESKNLTIYGNVDIREVDLGFRVMGKVDRLYFDEGDRVKPGDLLATLDAMPYADKVNKAKAEYTSLQINMQNAKRQMQRRDIAKTSLAVSEEDAENAKASFDEMTANLKASAASLALAEIDLADTKLLCPSSGTILTRIKEVGSVLSTGTPVFTVALDEPIWIRCYVAEPDLGNIYPGMEAEIRTDTKGSPVYRGHIGFISSVAEFTPKNVETPQLRTDLVFRLRVIVDNPDERLRQGMPVTVHLKKNRESTS